MPRACVNYVLAATLVQSGITLEEAAKRCGAKNANVLAVGLRRKGVTATLARSLDPTDSRIKTLTLRVATQASELLKKDMGELLATHTQALKQVPAKVDVEHIRSVGAALEPLARTAKLVHGWGDETVGGLDMSSVWVEQTPQEQPAINVTPQQIVDTTPADDPSQNNGS